MQMALARTGRIKETLDYLGKKDYAFLKADYIYFPFKKKFPLYFMVRVFVYADRFWFILDVYVVPSEAPCDGHLVWLLFCGW